ncbi:MAG: DUF4835 family protein, partial [Bacteroidota bacterium]
MKEVAMKYMACLILSLLGMFPIAAQEIVFNVSIDADRLQTQQGSEREIFTDLQKQITSFLNNRKWSSDEFGKGEQINCDLLITLQRSPQINRFEGIAQLQSTRTIYNTNYESSLLFFVDRNFNFTYQEGQPLIFNENAFTDNLTSMLAFYAYVVLAMDYDSFRKLGGNPFVEAAFNVVNAAQSTSDAGWRRTQNTRSRFWLSENLNSQQMIPFREIIYSYHREAMDNYLSDPDKSRAIILEGLKKIQEVNRSKPSSLLVSIFFDAKSAEIVNIFKESTPETRKELRDLLVQ